MTPSFSERAQAVCHYHKGYSGYCTCESMEKALREAAAQAYSNAARRVRFQYGITEAAQEFEAKAAAIRVGNAASGGEGE